MRYEIHKLTGNKLINAAGYFIGNESAGKVATSSTLLAAELRLHELRRTCPVNRYELREVPDCDEQESE